MTNLCPVYLSLHSIQREAVLNIQNFDITYADRINNLVESVERDYFNRIRLELQVIKWVVEIEYIKGMIVGNLCHHEGAPLFRELGGTEDDFRSGVIRFLLKLIRPVDVVTVYLYVENLYEKMKEGMVAPI